MKLIKWILVVAVVYVGIVVAFESLIGYFQPEGETTLVITTTDGDGESSSRVLSRLVSDGELYVAANHWPRAWYREALDNPAVQVELDGETRDYVAVPVSGDEFARVDREHELGPLVRFLTGFPPRRLMRLEPASPE